MHDLTATVAGNFARVRAEIAAAARAPGRKPEEIRLIAVSKTHPPEAIAAAIAAGQMDFGENTIQEALTKIPLYESATWHMIGHLQSNKAKSVPGHFGWVHSVDSLRLAQRLSRLAQEKGIVLDALFEVNVTRDPAKHGLPPERAGSPARYLIKGRPPRPAPAWPDDHRPASRPRKPTAAPALGSCGNCAMIAGNALG